jgi:hypothetical protein
MDTSSRAQGTRQDAPAVDAPAVDAPVAFGAAAQQLAATAKLTNGAATFSTPPPAADRAPRRYRPFLRNKWLEVAPCRPVSPRREEKEREEAQLRACRRLLSRRTEKIVDSEADSGL